MTLLEMISDFQGNNVHKRILNRLVGSMRDSPRRCRSASVDRLAVARPHSSRQQRIGCSCCRHNNVCTDSGDVTTDVVTSRPLTASSRTARQVRPRTAKAINGKEPEKDQRKGISKPPISPQARPASRISFGIRHARSTSSVNAAGTSVTASSSRSHLTSEGHGTKVNPAGNHDSEEYGERLQDSIIGRMSLSELPPINGVTSGRRPGSGRSRRSSTHSQGSRSGGAGGSGNALARAETTEIVALNGYVDSGKMTKRSNRSPGSTGGSSGRAPSNGTGTGTSPRVTATGTGTGGTGSGGSSDGGIRFRAKSWCAPDGSSMVAVAAKAADSKLETLFEAKTQQRERRVSDNNAPRVTNGLSRVGGGGEDGGELFKRTKSFNNLNKGSDPHQKPGAQGRQSQQPQATTKSRGLYKVSSDQNIAGKGATGRTQATTLRRRNASTGQNPNLGKQQQQQQLQQKPLRASKSTPNFESQNRPNNNNNDPSSPTRGTLREDPKATIAAIAAANEKAGTEITSFSEDNFEDVDPEEGEREQRIIDWLIGVESERPERPPSPSIIDDEPTQTDTAIHIIYDGE